jgi:predicted GIY-YIG superfamily endonuclease
VVVEYWVLSNTFINDITKYQKGSSYPAVTNKQILERNIPLAPPEQQKRIVAKIEELFSHIDAGIEALKKAKQLLKQYRQSVLKAAVTGELTKDLPCRQSGLPAGKAGWRDSSFRNISDKRVPVESTIYFSYVLECEDSSLYKGYTQDLFARINQHLEGRGAKWTREYKPVALIHFEEFDTEKEAVEREKYYKSGSGREWINDIRNQQKKKHETAKQLLERILKERRQKWEEQQLEQFKAKGKIPKNDKWKEKHKESIEFNSDIEIPEEWVGVTTDQVFYYVTSGSRGWAKYYSEEGPIFLRMGNLEHYDVRLDLEDIQRVSPPEGAEGSRTKVEPGDSLISITADVGMVGIVPAEFEKAYINQHVSLARPVIRSMGLYLAWLLSGDFAKEQFKALQRGATKVGLGLDDIKAIQFGLPPIEEQEEIVRIIEEKLSSIEHLNNELDQQLIKAEKNKQSVLASSFSGRI